MKKVYRAVTHDTVEKRFIADGEGVPLGWFVDSAEALTAWQRAGAKADAPVAGVGGAVIGAQFAAPAPAADTPKTKRAGAKPGA